MVTQHILSYERHGGEESTLSQKTRFFTGAQNDISPQWHDSLFALKILLSQHISMVMNLCNHFS